MKRLLLSALTLALAFSAQAAVETYKIDPTHSSVGFNIRHFFTKVPGDFTKFEGTITVDRDNLEKSSAEATIQATSIQTRNDKRDSDLRSDNFFAVEKYPTIHFKSTSWAKTGEDTFDVTGDLTIKEITHPVVLKVKSLGFGPGMQGAMLSGWEGTTKINRRDFGIKLNPGLEKVLGEDVEISISVEAGLKK
jgi:polyisoprenoid-binding protein YceI